MKYFMYGSECKCMKCPTHKTTGVGDGIMLREICFSGVLDFNASGSLYWELQENLPTFALRKIIGPMFVLLYE